MLGYGMKAGTPTGQGVCSFGLTKLRLLWLACVKVEHSWGRKWLALGDCARDWRRELSGVISPGSMLLRPRGALVVAVV